MQKSLPYSRNRSLSAARPRTCCGTFRSSPRRSTSPPTGTLSTTSGAVARNACVAFLVTDQARPRRVLDASAVLRLLLRGTPEVAGAIATGDCSAPDLIHHEVANGLVTNARAGYVDPPTAMLLLERFRTLEVD